MTINAQVTPKQFARIQSSLALDKLNAKKQAIKWFIDNLLIEHFQAGNTQRYGYTPNSQAYDLWKRKHGNNIQLVLSGELQKAVMASARVNPNATLRVSVPKYGIYQMELGRDFLKPNSSEITRINKMYKKFLHDIRIKTVQSIVTKYK
jgi:hypothetical protein